MDYALKKRLRKLPTLMCFGDNLNLKQPRVVHPRRLVTLGFLFLPCFLLESATTVRATLLLEHLSERGLLGRQLDRLLGILCSDHCMGPAHVLDVQPSGASLQLKVYSQDKLGTPTSRQRSMYCGKQLMGGQTLSDPTGPDR